MLRTVLLKQYIYGDENKDVQIVCFLQKMMHIVFLARVRKEFILTIS